MHAVTPSPIRTFRPIITSTAHVSTRAAAHAEPSQRQDGKRQAMARNAGASCAPSGL
jgi:hypothetical protein